jgi:16S rRNA (cytosine967-C5)-methyltransferase
VISRAAHRPIETIDEGLRAPLRLAALQLLELDRIPPHAAVSEAVDEARRRGGPAAAGFANGVLRAIARQPDWEAWPVEIADPIARLAIEGSHPFALVERWHRRFGEARTRAIVAANNGARRTHLLAFADRGGREALAASLGAEGVVTRPSALSPAGLEVVDGSPFATAAFARGDFYVQDAASQAAALVPMPGAGELVLDAAAAPGGKGLAILAVEPSARVVFADSSLARLRRLDENLRRFRRRAPRAVADALEPPWSASFDRVVLDAPCTGTGTLRRHPELRWRFSADAAERLAIASARMIRALAACARPGGMLLLVTCSIEAEENEDVIERALAGAPDLAPGSLFQLPHPMGDSVDDEAGCWRVFPAADHDGFTVHLLRRRR